MATTTININMDKTCTKCGDNGTTDRGLCLKCIADEVAGANKPAREFKKIKVDVKTKHLELSWTEFARIGEDTHMVEHETKFHQEVHEDMVQAMTNLIPHMLILTELRDDDEFNGVELMPYKKSFEHRSLQFEVASVSTGGDDEHFGISISGRKTLRGGKVFNINAPFTKFEGGEHEDKYCLAREMRAAYDVLVKEVNLFLDEGKAAPSKQTKMDFEQAA